MRPPSPPPPQQPPQDPPPQGPEQQQPPQQRHIRKLIVEVVEARDLLPKDGQGTSSPYVVADFDGQRRRTSTRVRELNPVWNEPLEFTVSDPATMETEELDIEVYNDKRMCVGGGGSGGAARRNHFLGRVKLNGSQFSRRGDEGLVYHPLEKKSVFSWIRGEIGLRIYYFDEMAEDGYVVGGDGPPPQDGGGGGQPPPHEMTEMPPEARRDEMRMMPPPPYPTEVAQQAAGYDQPPPRMMMMDHREPPPPGMMMEGPPPMREPPPPGMMMGPGQPPPGMMMGPGPGQPPPGMMIGPGPGQQPPGMMMGPGSGQPPPGMMMGPGPPPGQGPPPPPPQQDQSQPLPPQYYERGPPPQYPNHQIHQVHEMQGPPPPQEMNNPMNMHPPPPPPEMRRMPSGRERIRPLPRSNSESFSPRIIDGKKSPTKGGATTTRERLSAFDLVEPMQYLFVRIVKARGIQPSETPFVKIRSSNHFVRSKPASRPGDPPNPNPEWNQVFALGHTNAAGSNNNSNNAPSLGATLEISVWDASTEQFLGGVCFDLSDVPVRDPPDSPLAPQWYRLEGGGGPGDDPNRIWGDIQLAVWIGTQADDAFPEAWCSDAPSVSYTKSKVYQSPKLWYLRVTVIEAQDLHIPPNLPPLTAPELRVKGKLGFQTARTRRGSMNRHSAAVHWNEDLIFVAGEPLEDHLLLGVEDLTGREPILLGHVVIPVAAFPQRLDERPVVSKWVGLEGNGGGGPGAPGGGGPYCGRIHLRACLEGGYHVLEEAAQFCSDFRPTAKQLWKPAVGVLELGILGARGLMPMKTKGSGKGSTDAYCVAKYGKKWVRTRTITDSFDPRWNEQYTWQVYDPCTVLTIGVFDNWRMFSGGGGDMQGDEQKPDYRIGKVRIRISTLESNRVYTNSYPLLVLLRTGLKKMGEIEVAIRFVCPSLLPDTCTVYGQPLLPRMHYLRPLGVAQQEALRGAATRMVAGWLARSEPPLGPEVVRYLLDADSHTWSMRRSKANWYRIVAVLAWAIGLAKWLDDIRRWRNPVTTILLHVLYLVLIWYPDLIVPTGFLYVFLIGIWYYRFRPRIPAGMDIRLSQAEMVDPDELDEEFDTIPSSKPSEIIRMRYDRLRILAGRVQTVLGDLATQGERVQALVSWRDPRATKLFVGVCLIVTVVLYVVPAKMVAVALGFYFLRHPMFREPMPPSSLNFFRRLPSLSDRLI